jgi:hypothetical protein
MANTGKQSPLGINLLGSLLQNTGIGINPVVTGYIGSSKNNSTYTFGSIVQNSSLRMLTWAINDGYTRGPGNSNTTLTNTTYNNLISIGAGVLPALGNAVSSKYVVSDPSGVWTTTALAYAQNQGVSPALPGPVNSGYGITGNTDTGQQATWYPYDTTNPNAAVTQWGFLRLFALQAWNELNWNGSSPTQSTPQLKEFLSSFITCNSFMSSSNQAINAINNSNTFLQGVYSNMSDLISGDLSGVSLAANDFGNDLTNLGKALDLKHIATFGMPSTLLATIGKNGAMTQDLGLALLSAGLSNSDIASITSGNIPNASKNLEQQVYGAFLIITGENITHILAPLQCKTQGLDTLADLLNVRKIFPTSYPSLTVPVYNGTTGLPTNSKTYYPIYLNGGVNPNIDSPAIKEYIGTIVPTGTPPIFDNTTNPANYQTLPKGFGSYLADIIPADQAVAAGAFSYSMRQIKNIESLNFEKFAKVASGIENTADLPLVAGTDKPTNQQAIDTSTSICSLGSGPNGSYTMSNFFGCMSGLPYPWQLIAYRIGQLETPALYNIYQNLYLAVTWNGAVLAYTIGNSSPSNYYIATLSIVSSGGGYGRGGASAPVITLPFGASATCTIGTDPTDITTFGRVTGVNLVSGGSHPNGSGWYANIECPPTSSSGGTNTPSGTTGWNSPMNSVVQGYIDQANTEIANIASSNQTATTYLNAYWDILGNQLAIEQRSRYAAMVPVSVPTDPFLNPSPASMYTFVDSVPGFAQDTTPHGAAQTLEAISDMNSVGGQSAVALMRESRNQVRLQRLGIDQDNNIPDTLSDASTKQFIANGVSPVAKADTGITCPSGKPYTVPAWPANSIGDAEITPIPSGSYLPADIASANVTPGFQQGSGTNGGDITPILSCSPNPVVNPLVPAGPVLKPESRVDSVVIIAPPAEYNPANLPPNLDPNYTNSTLLPSTLSVQQAINHVIVCNCDCWIP